METLSYSTFEKKLSTTFDHVSHDHVEVVITRENAEPVVMISLQDYLAMQETNYLLQSPANAARLSDAIDEIEELIKKTKKN